MTRIHDLVHRFESDPGTQLKFHTVMTCFWIIAGIGVLFLPQLWSHSLGILVVLEVSLYANFATEYGAMSAAIAALQGDKEGA